MATKKKFKLALIGTDSLRGREIKNTLGQKKIGAFDLEFYDPEVKEEYSKLTEFKKEPKVIHGTSGDFLKGTDLLFLASDGGRGPGLCPGVHFRREGSSLDPETNRAFGLRALEQGCRAIELDRDADITAFEAIFRKAAAFKLTAFRESCSASSITVSGKDEIFVGRIKKEESGQRTFWIWLVADNVTRGSAVNAVEIAKKILKARPA
ncbi:MAG: Asd/ArgC dimerization domain-containing protein [Candidatus Aminicenantes bacterium]|nr:Asd/ArgC dimerization domain-containing protein [Candidatus Aminicenantes bacterium]